jgi:hypothetical protein
MGIFYTYFSKKQVAKRAAIARFTEQYEADVKAIEDEVTASNEREDACDGHEYGPPIMRRTCELCGHIKEDKMIKEAD